MLHEFKNIVGTIPVSEIAFMPEKMPNLTMTRFFLVKRALKDNVYNHYVYATGLAAGEEHRCVQCFDIFNQWRYSMNNDCFMETEVIEIIFP